MYNFVTYLTLLMGGTMASLGQSVFVMTVFNALPVFTALIVIRMLIRRTIGKHMGSDSVKRKKDN